MAIVDAQGRRLPDDTRLLIRYDNGAEQTVEPRFHDQKYVYNQTPITRPFQYKAVGGDDRSMPWVRLEVVEPPVIQSLAIKLHPPEYASWPTTASGREIRGLKGTRVEFSGVSTKPLQSAQLKLGDDRLIAARIVDDGYGFALPAPPPGAAESEASASSSNRIRSTRSKWSISKASAIARGALRHPLHQRPASDRSWKNRRTTCS